MLCQALNIQLQILSFDLSINSNICGIFFWFLSMDLFGISKKYVSCVQKKNIPKKNQYQTEIINLIRLNTKCLFVASHEFESIINLFFFNNSIVIIKESMNCDASSNEHTNKRGTFSLLSWYNSCWQYTAWTLHAILLHSFFVTTDICGHASVTLTTNGCHVIPKRRSVIDTVH